MELVRNTIISCVHSKLVLQTNSFPTKHTRHMSTMKNTLQDKHSIHFNPDTNSGSSFVPDPSSV